jgi:uncharacterized SAM-binding protein YcdF (DUF218 family)
LAALACLFFFALQGYSTLGLVCLGLLGLLVFYRTAGRLRKKYPKPIKAVVRTVTSILCIGLAAAAITGGIIVHGSFGQPDTDCDYVIVLGAGVNGNVPSLSLRNRIDGAYNYLAANPDAICIVSGGQGTGENISEAECMFRELTKMGIGAERIWQEDQSTTTRENLKFSLDLIQQRTGIRPTEIGLVSSEYHLYRAGLFAQEQGVTAYGIPAETSWVSLRINYYLREIVAVWYYTLLGG